MTHTPEHRPELLAPAGGPESLRAAVNNGADAVYLGVDRLNARRGAENFTMDVLGDATRFAHLRGSKVYLTANVLVHTEETHSALELIDQAWVAGVDAVIVQDLGLLAAIRRELPAVRIHASTQLNAHNTATLEYLAGIGASRVTLARETSVGEIATLAGAASVEIESFVHGALCVCYSGQCLMSSLIGGRSANRGTCAQPCRLGYELLDPNGGVKRVPGQHLLSPKDLCGIDVLPRLVRSGVTALKIEGRMKSPEYVALVTGVYRAALDRAIEDPDGFAVTESERSILAEAFNRGFSSAYLDDVRDNEMMSYLRPNNRGVPVGRVSKVRDREVLVALDAAVDAADTVEYWTSRGRFAQKIGTMTMRGSGVNVGPAGETVAVRTDKPVSQGDRVFRVVNAQLDAAARRTFVDERGLHPLPLDMSVRVVVGRPVRVGVRHGVHEGSATGPVVERARTRAVSAEDVAEHVGRLGATLFEATQWDIELSPDAGLGFSTLHKVRREAVEALECSMLEPWAGRDPVNPPLKPPTRRKTRATDFPELVVHTEDLRIARACLDAGAQRAYVPSWVLQQPGVENVPDRVVPVISRIVHDREADDLVSFAAEKPRVLVGNLGLLEGLSGGRGVVEADWSLNALNPWTVSELASAGAGFVWLSPELSGRQLAAIAGVSTVPVGTAIYGRQELMVTEHCMLMSMGECGQVCGACPRRQSWYALRDQKGYGFPVSTDPAGRSHIYNSVPLDLTRAIPELFEAGVSALRLDFTIEHLQVAQKITRIAKEAMAAAAQSKPTEEFALVPKATTGHFYRGVK